jgi:hypothetical protein
LRDLFLPTLLNYDNLKAEKIQEEKQQIERRLQ